MTLHFLASSACAYLTAEAWPISRPVQRLAGIRRLERNARRWRLRISRWIYEVTGPRYALKLLRYPRRNQVAPDFKVACELSHRWRGRRRSSTAVPHFGAPSPASTITSSFSPALFLRRNPAASLYSSGLKQATPGPKVGNSIQTKRLKLSGPSRV